MEPDCRQCGAILTEYISEVSCGNSCRECGRYSYFTDEPSYLYLITNVELGLHKVGIGTVGKDKKRLQQLIQAGWSAKGVWHAAEKGKTFQWEQEVFKQLKLRIEAADSDLTGFVGRSDGHWVENISARVISEAELAQLIATVVSAKVK